MSRWATNGASPAATRREVSAAARSERMFASDLRSTGPPATIGIGCPGPARWGGALDGVRTEPRLEKGLPPVASMGSRSLSSSPLALTSAPRRLGPRRARVARKTNSPTPGFGVFGPEVRLDRLRRSDRDLVGTENVTGEHVQARPGPRGGGWTPRGDPLRRRRLQPGPGVPERDRGDRLGVRPKKAGEPTYLEYSIRQGGSVGPRRSSCRKAPTGSPAPTSRGWR